ncbi:MAG: ISAs1 family transposase [Anaerolineae bacterium]
MALRFEHIRHYDGWAGLNAIVRIQRERRIKEQIQQETAYYIISLALDAQRILDATRQHWSIENQLHRVMHVTFNEDQMRCEPDRVTVRRTLSSFCEILLSIFSNKTNRKAV